jgi:hypothetical protein
MKNGTVKTLERLESWLRFMDAAREGPLRLSHHSHAAIALAAGAKPLGIGVRLCTD